MPRYSVLIPVYNGENCIERCLESVLCQHNNLLEIIIIDDGSMDNTKVILDKYASKYPFIKVTHQENVNNLLKVRCDLIKQATGDYILFLDADDTWSKNYIQVINTLISKEHPDCVLFDANIINGKKEYHDYLDYEKLLSEKDTPSLSLIYQIIKDNKLNALWKKCYKRTLFDTDELNGLKVSIGEDTILNLNGLVNAKKISYTNQPLYNYYITPGSISSCYKNTYFRDFEIVCEKMEIAMDILGVKEEFDREYSKRMIEMLVAPFARVKLKDKESIEIFDKKFEERRQDNNWIQRYEKYKNDFSIIFKLICDCLIKNNYKKLRFINKIVNCKLAEFYLKWRRNAK